MRNIYLLLFVFFLSLFTNCFKKNTTQFNQNDSNNSLISNDSSILNVLKIEGCAQSKTKKGTQILDVKEIVDLHLPEISEQPIIFAIGDSIIYSRQAEHLCCRTVSVNTSRVNNNISIKEHWQHQGCKCKCSSIVNVVLPKIPKGAYNVFTIITETDPFSDKYLGKLDTINIKEIIIK